jgi:hypothetical protein
MGGPRPWDRACGGPTGFSKRPRNRTAHRTVAAAIITSTRREQQLSRLVRRTFVTATAALIAFGGLSIAAPTIALAKEPPSQGCATANAKGGPRTCEGNGAAPVHPREKECYRGGAIGMIPGAITGNPGGMAGGAIAGCVSAVTAP